MTEARIRAIAPPKMTIAVSRRALEANLRTLRRVADRGPAIDAAPLPPGALLAVIKADAYGHGAALCAPVLARAGVEWLGVTDAAEGAHVRESLARAGIEPDLQPRILVMCGLLPADTPALLAHRLTPVVWLPAHLEALAAAHRPGTPPVAVHLEIDTGMARQGVLPDADLACLLAYLAACPRLRLDGVFTHFASAEIAGCPLTALQQDRFAQALRQVRGAGLRPGWVHAGNSSTLDEGRLLPWLHMEAAALGARLLARTGLALFGYVLPLTTAREDDPAQPSAPAQLAPALHPVATWSTSLIAVRDAFPGDTVGYNATFTATRPMRLGLLPIGYADGLRRELSSSAPSEQPPHQQRADSGGWVMISGRRAPIVGRVSMNLTTVDLSAIPDAAPGDSVTVLGPGVSAEDHAALAGTISYEILCGLRGHRILVP